jgi:wobble nucleotide-excising tRNase
VKRVGHPVVKTKYVKLGGDNLHQAVTVTVKTRAEEIPTTSGGAEMKTVTTDEDIAREMIEDVQNTTAAQAQTDTVVDLNKSPKNNERKLKHLSNLKVKCCQPLWAVFICLHTK